MSKRLTDEERADLVAFLDGELTGEAARSIEARISLDPQTRAEAESLKRTWDLLDFLPRPEPSPSFTERTMSKLVPVVDAPRPAVPRFRRARVVLGAGWAAALLLSAWAGYAGYRAITPGVAGSSPDPRLVENKRLGELAGVVELLEEPDHPDPVSFASWLKMLPEGDRASILEAADGPTRLKVIREIRDREWAMHLPAKLREELQALPHGLRGPRIAELREEDRRQRLLWQKGTPFRDEPILRPGKFSEFTPETRAYIDDLKRQLSDEDKARLAQAEGKWPDLPRVVRELAETHPKLPPLPTGPITRWFELPAEVQKAITGSPKRRLAKQLQGYRKPWPEYALDVLKAADREKLSLPPLGASRPRELPEEVRKFLDAKLFPLLNVGQKELLAAAEGRWPEYPRQLARVARDRQLLIPGMTLPPGPVKVWENVRLALPNMLNRPDLFAREEAGLEELADPQRPRGKEKTPLGAQ